MPSDPDPSPEPAAAGPPDDLTRARAELAAVRDVLHILSRSSENLDTSLQAVAEAAARLCRADLSQVWLRDGDYLVAGPSGPPDVTSVLVKPGDRRGPLGHSHGPGLDAARTGRTVHAEDLGRYLSEHRPSDPVRSRWARRDPWASVRTVLAVPLLRAAETFGVLMLSRRGAGRPFLDGEIALAETFADQAVIAMENARLFEELQQRNREQAEALEREQATAEVLRVISRSPENLDVSLQAVADTAARLCRADMARVMLREDDYLVAGPGAPTGSSDAGDRFPLPERLGAIADLPLPAGEAVRTGRTVHAEDILAYLENHGTTGSESFAEYNLRSGLRTVLAVPMLRGSDVIGVVAFTRGGEVQPFSDREIALAETFADQAAIAVENARLFQGIQERNHELTDALEQQTATSEILRIIAGSPTDVQPVLDAIVESAARLCHTTHALFLRRQDRLLHPVAMCGFPEVERDFYRNAEFRLSERNQFAVTASQRRVIAHTTLPDDPALAMAGPVTQEYMRRFGTASMVTVPVLAEGDLVGVLAVGVRGVKQFDSREIRLLQTFADQAVIAIENVRLFNDLEDRTQELARSVEQLEALGEVTRTVSSTLDLDEVLRTIVRHTQQLCATDDVIIFEFDAAAEEFRLQVHSGIEDDLSRALAQQPLRLGEGAVGRAGQVREPVQVADILDFSKIDAGRLELEEQPFELRECVESALDLVAHEAAQKSLDLAYFIDDGVPATVSGDVTRLRQILVNLLGNAVKFTQRGEVVLTVSNEERATSNETSAAPSGQRSAVDEVTGETRIYLSLAGALP